MPSISQTTNGDGLTSRELHELLDETGLLLDAPPVPEDLLLARLDSLYGLQGTLKRIATEKDHTFRLRATQGEFVVKVATPNESRDVVAFQVDLIAYLERQAVELPVQRLQRARDGATHTELRDGNGAPLGDVRVLRFVPGTILAEVDPSAAQLDMVGELLGRVDAVLERYHHPAEKRRHVWDISHFLLFEELGDCETDPVRRAIAKDVFDRFRLVVQPALHRLRRQTIHGDFSPFNVVVDALEPAFVTGVIDFGDAVECPVVFDPAVPIANYIREATGEPWAESAAFLRGYSRVQQLGELEVEVLTVAAVARLLLRALLNEWRSRIVPSRAEYLREHALHDWARLENALSFSWARGTAVLMEACTRAGEA